MRRKRARDEPEDGTIAALLAVGTICAISAAISLWSDGKHALALTTLALMVGLQFIAGLAGLSDTRIGYWLAFWSVGLLTAIGLAGLHVALAN